MMSLSSYQKWECALGIPAVLYFLLYMNFIKDGYDNIATALLGSVSVMLAFASIMLLLTGRVIIALTIMSRAIGRHEWKNLFLSASNACAFILMAYIFCDACMPGLPKICFLNPNCSAQEKIANLLFLCSTIIASGTGYVLRGYQHAAN